MPGVEDPEVYIEGLYATCFIEKTTSILVGEGRRRLSVAAGVQEAGEMDGDAQRVGGVAQRVEFNAFGRELGPWVLRFDEGVGELSAISVAGI